MCNNNYCMCNIKFELIEVLMNDKKWYMLVILLNCLFVLNIMIKVIEVLNVLVNVVSLVVVDIVLISKLNVDVYLFLCFD